MRELARSWLAAVRRVGVSNTKRAAVLAVVVCALALTVAVPLRTYLSQRSEIATQQQRQDRLRGQVDQLQRRNQQLQDPEQIKAEARKRLRYVMPGETPYLVQLPEAGKTGHAQHAKQSAHSEQRSWYTNLWDSINK